MLSSTLTSTKCFENTTLPLEETLLGSPIPQTNRTKNYFPTSHQVKDIQMSTMEMEVPEQVKTSREEKGNQVTSIFSSDVNRSDNCHESDSKKEGLKSSALDKAQINISVLPDYTSALLEEDINIEDLSTSHLMSDSSIDLQLRFQRLLAESALENSVLSSTFMNKIEDDKSQNVFQQIHLSGHSTPRGSTSSFFSSSDIEKNKDLQALFEKYASEDFIPAEKATDKLLKDEIEWKKHRGNNLESMENLNLSSFSGIFGDAEISLRSTSNPSDINSKRKVCPEEYFGLKTNDISSLFSSQSGGTKLNCSTKISSSEGEEHKSLMEKSGNNSLSKFEKSNQADMKKNSLLPSEQHLPVKVNSPIQQDNTLSLSTIQRVLSEHLQDTPTTIAKTIMHTKNKTKGIKNINSHIESLVPDKLSEKVSSTPPSRETSITDWVQLNISQEELETYIGTHVQAEVHIRNQSTMWIKCSIILQDIIYNGESNMDKDMYAKVDIPEYTLIGPNQESIDKVGLLPYNVGSMLIKLCINLEDAVTKSSENIFRDIKLAGKIPKIEVHMDGKAVNSKNFGILPEKCFSSCSLQIYNFSDLKIPLRLELEEVPSDSKTFSLFVDDMKNVLNNVTTSFLGSCHEPLNVNIKFKSPALEEKDDSSYLYFSAYLNISIDISEQQCFLLKKLKLDGCVGRTDLQMCFSTPIILTPNSSGTRDIHKLYLKNGGVVPLKLKLVVIEPLSLKVDNFVKVQEPSLSIEPGKEVSFTLLVLPTWFHEKTLNRKLLMQILPGGEMFCIDINGQMAHVEDSHHNERLLSSPSSRSSESESESSSKLSRQVVGGMLVQTTHRQLIWSSVPVGKSETQSCRLRNHWPHPVKVLLTLVDTNHAYRLLNEHGDPVVHRRIKLLSKECVTFNVVFCPSIFGAAYGKVTVQEPKSTLHNDRFAIPLYGFGGISKLQFKHIPKDKLGQMWLNLGQLDNTLHTQFTIQNKGNQPGFAYIKFILKGMGCLSKPVITINPSQIVIAENSSQVIEVVCQFQDEDISLWSKDSRDVVDIGVIYLIAGDDSTRHRIRRIRDKYPSSRSNPLLDLDGLCSSFPGEEKFSDLNFLEDPESALRFLYSSFHQHEITLTIDKGGDKTLAMQTFIGNGNLGNQSHIFKSLIMDTTTLASTHSGKSAETWTVTPLTLTLLIPKFMGGCITISNHRKGEEVFEVSSSENFLTVDPSSGLIPGLGEVVLSVTCDGTQFYSSPMVKAHLKVYFENDVKTVTVHIRQQIETAPQSSKIGNIVHFKRNLH